MSQDPSVSVIVPVHNGADFIGTAFQSLERQFDDPSRMQVVLVDDGSTDDTMEIAQAFSERVGELTALRNETPHGIGSARIQGLEAADREYVAFLDADDWMAPGRLPHLARRCAELGVDFLRTDHVKSFENGSGRVIERAPDGRREKVLNTRDAILPVSASTMIDYPFPWAGIFNRCLVDDGRLAYDHGLHSFEDRVAIWRLFLTGTTFAVVNAPWIFYRRSVASSLTQVFDARQLDFVHGFEFVADMLATDPDRAVLETKMVRQFLAIAAHHVERSHGMSRATRADLRRAIRTFAETLEPDALQEQWGAITAQRRRLLSRSVQPVLREVAT